MKFLKLSFIALISITLLSQCATLVGKSTYPIYIHSSPTNARLKITNTITGHTVYKGTTPCQVYLRASVDYFKRAAYSAEFTLDDYEKVILPITFSLDGWYIVGNIFVGGLIGYLIVDPLSGAMWKADLKYIKAYLGESVSHADAPSLHILDINEIPEEMLAHLERIH